MKNLLLISLTIIFSLQIQAQKVTFTAKSKKRVSVGQVFQVTYTLNNAEDSKFIEPDFNGFDVGGYSNYSSYQQSTTYRNGKRVTETIQSTNWIVTLVAKTNGTFTIEPATAINKNGKNYKSNSLTIVVGNGQNSDNNIADNKDNSNESDNIKNPSMLFINAYADRNEAYIGEQIILTSKLFSRYGNLSVETLEFPDFSGFWNNDIETSQSRPKEVVLNNVSYATILIHKKVLIPQKIGKIFIEPYEAKCILYNSWRMRTGTKMAYSSKLEFNIKPLPKTNKPTDFSGAVGQFSMKDEINNSEISVNETVGLKITISGTGNFQLFDTPLINSPNSFEQLDSEPVEKNNYSAKTSGITGSKTIEYNYIARAPGNFSIPPIKFSYFDPKKEKYYILTTKNYKIKVIGNKDSLDNQNYTNNTEMEELGSDINYIFQEKFRLKQKNQYFFGSISFLFAFLIPILILILFILFRKKQEKDMDNIEQTISRKARKIAKKRLKNAEKFMKINNKDEFYQEITNALWGYLSDKFSIPTSELTRENITEILQKNNIKSELINRIINIIDKCEYAKYAPATDNNEIQQIYIQASQIIIQIEQNSKQYFKKSL